MSELSSGKLILLFVVGLVGAGLVAAGALTLTAVRPAALQIVSDPPGATVFVNGSYRGVTPLEVSQLHPGTHAVRVLRSHYEPWQREVVIRGSQNRVDAQLVYLTGGTVSVSSTPPGAAVYMDGEPKGQTPIELTDVPPGVHPLRLALVNHLEWTGEAEVMPRQTASVEVRMKSRVEDYLIRETRKDSNLANTWLELFHYYVITHAFDKAPDALAHSLDCLTRYPSLNMPTRARVYQEVEKIWDGDRREVDYGGAPFIEKAREAIEQGFELAVELNADDPSNYGYLLGFYQQHERVDKGNALLEKGLNKFPYDRSWYMTERQGRRGTDTKGLQDRLKKAPEDAVARMELVTQMERGGQLDEAIALYPDLIRQMTTPTVKFALLQSLGNLYERRTRNKEALATYDEALKLEAEPKYRAALLYRVVRLKREAADVDGTVAAWEEAIRIQPDVEYACRGRLALAEMCVTEKRYEKAKQLCEEVLRISENDGSKERAKKIVEELPKS